MAGIRLVAEGFSNNRGDHVFNLLLLGVIVKKLCFYFFVPITPGCSEHEYPDKDLLMLVVKPAVEVTLWLAHWS